MADLWRAACFGEVGEVQLLLGQQADVSTTDEGGDTPLHMACSKAHPEVVNLLIKAGAALDDQNIGGNTPLHDAADKGHTEIVETLIGAGARVDTHNTARRTPIHSAAYWGHTEVVKLLISAGAPLDAQDKSGNTTLHVAAAKGAVEIVKLLISAGSPVDVKNKRGKTAREVAENSVVRTSMDHALLFESKYAVQVPLDRVKVFLCGDGQVGKSTLARALQRGDLSMRLRGLPSPTDARTHGFDTFPATIPSAGKCTIVDFAGQPEYWAPNGVFMDTASGIFLVVCNLTDPFKTQYEQLRYWVRLIGSHARPEHPPRVVLVGTHRAAGAELRARLKRADGQGVGQGTSPSPDPLFSPTSATEGSPSGADGQGIPGPRAGNSGAGGEGDPTGQKGWAAQLQRLEQITKNREGDHVCPVLESYLTDLRAELGHVVSLPQQFHYIDSVRPSRTDCTAMAQLRKCIDGLMQEVRSTRTVPEVCADVLQLLPSVRRVLPAVAGFAAVHSALQAEAEESNPKLNLASADRTRAILGYLAQGGHVLYLEEVGDVVVVDPQAFGHHVIGQLFCPVDADGFTAVMLMREDGVHFRRSELEKVLEVAREQGHIFGDVGTVLRMLEALELVIPLAPSPPSPKPPGACSDAAQKHPLLPRSDAPTDCVEAAATPATEPALIAMAGELGAEDAEESEADDPLFAVPGRLSQIRPGSRVHAAFLERPADCWSVPPTPSDWHYVGVRLTISRSQLMIPPSLFPRLQHRLRNEPGFRMWRHGLRVWRLTHDGRIMTEGLIELHADLERMDVCARSETGDVGGCVKMLARLATACQGFALHFVCSTLSPESLLELGPAGRQTGPDPVDDSLSTSIPPSDWILARFKQA